MLDPVDHLKERGAVLDPMEDLESSSDSENFGELFDVEEMAGAECGSWTRDALARLEEEVV